MVRLIVFTAFWAETSLHNGLVSQILSVSTLVGNVTTDSSTSSVVDNIVLLVEDRR